MGLSKLRSLRTMAHFSVAAVMAIQGVAAPGVASAASGDNPLVAERWKTRPVVLVVPAKDHALLRRLEAALQETATREAFLERDMVLYTVVAGQGRRNDRALDPRQTRALLDGLNLDAKGAPTFILVGKDGGTKMTEGVDVDLEAVFAEIDGMPMRQR